ncbi:DUF397 domain-containing protein [Streptomyces sp. NPDC020996]|uniref:DUF397 domain-containing protein n=1 Tax=Streptomyces sp. NPDC020996 TaxID=3154791 RepID=UPI0033D0A48D
MSTDQHTAQTAGLTWFKSSYSGTSGGDCVEVAAGLDVVYVRDSKATGDRPVLRIARAEWAAFVRLAVR